MINNIYYVIISLLFVLSQGGMIYGQGCPPAMVGSSSSSTELFYLSAPNMSYEWCDGQGYWDANPDCQTMSIEWEVEFTSRGTDDWQYVVEIHEVNSDYPVGWSSMYYDIIYRTSLTTGPKSWDMVHVFINTPVKKGHTYRARVSTRKKHLGVYLGWVNNVTRTINVIDCKYDCVTDRNLTNTFYNGDNYYVRAQNIITATNVIKSGADIDYLAGNAVKLKPGFHAEKGAVFHADIESCSILKSTGKQKGINEIIEMSKANLELYPNPTQGILKLDFNNTESPVDIAILDVSGRVVYNNTHHEHNVEIDLSEYGKGLFIVSIQSEELNETRKITVF